MKRLLATALLLGPLVAGAQVISTTPDPSQPPAPAPQGVPPPPEAMPPPPDLSGGPDVQEPPPPAYAQPQVTPPVAPVPGQWVYTPQYGWVWMPYSSNYTVVSGAYPEMYVYWPAYGWRWVVAPWVWGLGPRPYFGLWGWAHYGWYGHGWGRWYGWPRSGPAWADHGAWVRAPHAAWHPAYRGSYPVARPQPMPARPGGFGHPGTIGRAAPVPRPGGFGGAVRPGSGGGFGGAARPGWGGGAHLGSVRGGGFGHVAPHR